MPQQIVQKAMPAAMRAAAGVAELMPKRTARRSFDQNTPIYKTFRSMETRLARTFAEIRAAQSLRFEIFYEEMSAIADALTLVTRLDNDGYDRICDHLLVIDHEREEPRIIATHRLLRQTIADQQHGFYSIAEFDLEPLLSKFGNLNFLELGRSCVLPQYRNKRTIELLWRGTWSYVRHYGIDVMIGCASFEGTDPNRLSLPLSFLRQQARAPKDWRVHAVTGRGISMASVGAINTPEALRALPPLIRAYLRLGAWVGEEAVVDRQFGTTDVLIILPVANIKQRYLNYYGGDAG